MVLKRHKIEFLADIRRFPTSKLTQFKKENLERALKKANIEYVHLECLEGYRGGYGKYMRSIIY